MRSNFGIESWYTSKMWCPKCFYPCKRRIKYPEEYPAPWILLHIIHVSLQYPFVFWNLLIQTCFAWRFGSGFLSWRMCFYLVGTVFSCCYDTTQRQLFFPQVKIVLAWIDLQTWNVFCFVFRAINDCQNKWWMCLLWVLLRKHNSKRNFKKLMLNGVGLRLCGVFI